MAWIVAMLAAAFVLLAPARADDAVDRVNNQQSLVVGIAPLHASEFAIDAQGARFANTAATNRYMFGYDLARTRNLLGIRDLYTDFEFSLAAGTLRYTGRSISATNGATAAIDDSITYVQEAIRIRIGRSLPFPGRGRFALTPFLGLSQQAWSRDSSAGGVANFYDHEGIEAGALMQLGLPFRLVLGADASVGRTLGTILFGGGAGNGVYAKSTSFALKLDHRTSSSWHQRLELRQTTLRYGQFPDVTGYFEPRRTSDQAILLEFGTESSIL